MQDIAILTVTVATYNVEDFIQECLDSIIKQTFQDFELICIDDGSSDETVTIIKQYALKDKRIRLIENTENQGLAVIRNQSLLEAKGKYILFLDGDDLYDPNYFEKAIQLAEKENSDLVFSDYLSFSDRNEISQLKKVPSELKNSDKDNKISLLQRPAFACIKLIKTNVAKDLKIFFPPGYTRQDIPVHWHLITQVDKISLLPEKLSFYRQQPNATTAKKDEKLFHLAYVLDIVKKYLKENDLYEKYKNEFLRQQLNLLFGMFDSIQDRLKPQAKEIITNRLTDEHYKYIKEGNAVRKQAKYFYLSLRGDFLAKIKFTIWLNARFLFRKIKSI